VGGKVYRNLPRPFLGMTLVLVGGVGFFFSVGLVCGVGGFWWFFFFLQVIPNFGT